MGIIRNEQDIADALDDLVRCDRRLALVAAQAGPIPLRNSEPGFAGLAHIVVSQMVSRASAQAIWNRMVTEGRPLSPADFLAAGPQGWRAFGLSGAKASCLAALAQAVLAKRIDFDELARQPAPEAMAKLTALHGIGPWTAEVYLMFCCGHADIFPAGDVALQNAVAAAFNLAERPNAASLAAISSQWAPWRSVAARLFWAYYSNKLKRGLLPID